MRFIIVTSLLLYAALSSAQEVVELWPNELPPFAKPVANTEYIEDCWGGVRCAHEVTRPTLSFYPSAGTSDSWVLIAPGGGYSVVAIYHEGAEIAAAFVDRGISAAVLKYRIPNIETATAPEKVPLADLRRAMELLRSRQKSAGVTNGKIGMVGFSASGHLAAYAAVHPDANPQLNFDFTVLLYGVSRLDAANREWLEESLYYRPLTDEEFARETLLDRVSPATPPAFIVHAIDDEVSSYAESTSYADALMNNGVDVELHLFPQGGHGFGPGRDSDGTSQWIDLAVNWINRLDP